MREETVVYKVLKFDELSIEAQNKAVNHLCDINVDCDWWEFTYEDAERIGLKIKEFDLGRASYVKGDLTLSVKDTCEKILKEHGEACDTHKLAKEYLSKIIALQDAFDKIDETSEDNETELSDKMDTLEDDFEHLLCEEYRVILSKEYEYLTSREAIIETIQANDYEFTENGNFYT